MKNKFLSIILVLSLVTTCLFNLTACGKKETPVTQQQWNMAFDSMTNYSIKGGVSPSSPDYIECYFEDNGFRISMPNNPVTTNQDLYAKCDNGTYTKYVKTATGSWYYEPADEEYYKSTQDYVFELYLNFAQNVNSFIVIDGAFVNKEEITNTVEGRYTIKYYDVVININSQGKITSATWKQKMIMPDGAFTQSTMTLTVGEVLLNYPSPSGTFETQTDWDTALTFSNFKPVTIVKDIYTIKFDGKTLYEFCDSQYTKYEYYFVKDGENYYKLSRDNYWGEMGEWEETPISEQAFYSNVQSRFSYVELFPFAQFSLSSFDTNKLEYTAQPYEAFYRIIKNANILFENGKCTKITYEDDVVREIFISYGDFEIDVPSV